MELQKIREIVAQQREEVHRMNVLNWCDRMEEQFLELDSPLAQIVIGVRRSGKSTLCHKFLKQNNINYAYINFDDERTVNFQTEDFDRLLEALTIVYGDFKYLFIDEPQNVNYWHLFVNRLLRMQIHVFLTGSNAKLLSGELATHLTGRYNQIELYPLSFSEYATLLHVEKSPLLIRDKAALQIAYENYLTKGGLPEIVRLNRWRNYIANIFNAILERDIIQRFHIRYPSVFHDIALYLLSNFTHECNYDRIAATFGVASDKTVRKYVSYLEQAYLFIPLHKFSYKSRIRTRNAKLYVVDTAFASAMNELSSNEEGGKLENIVFLELLRRRRVHNYELFYHKNGYEIDFVLTHGKKVVELIQVCSDISNERTLQRELKALTNGSEELHCTTLTLITNSDSKKMLYKDKNIRIVSVKEWLLGENAIENEKAL